MELPHRLPGLISNGWENPTNKPRRQGVRQESFRVDTTFPLSPHSKIQLPYENNYENMDHHRRLIAGTLHSLANHRHAAVHRHHHRYRVTLFRPEVSHRVQRSPHQMEQPHSHRTHDHPYGLFRRRNGLRIRFRNRPAKRQLYTSRVGSRSLPLPLPHPSHHARNHYRNRCSYVPLPALAGC